MAHSNEFIEYLLELLHGVGDVKARAMFGGYGLYFCDALSQESLMFALVADEILYFKTDENSRSEFEARGLEAFTYERNGKPFSMSYNEAPGEALDDPDEMTDWTKKAIRAARRGATKKQAR